MNSSLLKNDLLAKVSWRLIPLLFLSYICAYLDRINIGFASKSLKAELDFSDSVYGLGAGIFFLGYALFEIPSNVIMGDYFGGNVTGEFAPLVLYFAVSARRCGGWFFSGNHFVPDLLVSP